MACLKPSEYKFDTKSRTADVQLVQHRVVVKIPLEISVRCIEVDPFELVSDTGHGLPGQIRLSGTDIQVTEHVPFFR